MSVKEKKEVAISVKNLSKHFRLPTEQSSSLKQAVVNRFRGIKGYKEQQVLKDVSFDVMKGDFFGIVGRNGSGKSTLLKLISGIYEPDGGSITVNGSLVSFIELGVGFNPELTGRENVYLNGALMGFSVKEIDAMYDEIVDFAELSEFMEQKLKNYSSGMQVRLAFACAIRAKSDILVLDEVLAVGDEAFQKKCYQYFANLKKNKKTVILVTHNMDSVQQFCNKVLLIDKGHKTQTGSPIAITQIYRELNDSNVTRTFLNRNMENDYIRAKMTSKIDDGKIKFIIDIKNRKTLEDPIVAFEIFRDTGEQVYRWASDEKEIKINSEVDTRIFVNLENIFPVGLFDIRLLVRKRDRSLDYGSFNNITKFEISNKTPYQHSVFWKPKEESYAENSE
jgi:ABC-2 type transport system ATP-binding protein